MTEIPQKAVIYCRVSSKGQEVDGHGLESQETRCRQHAAAKGYETVAVFPDTITGGVDFMQRPGMVALLSFLDAQPDERFVVIFDDLKRFARDTRFHLDLRDAFRQRGAAIECLNFKFDDTPEGEFIETIMAAQGALERKQNGRQVAQKMRARMQSGYWVFKAPVGYRYVQTKGEGKILTPDETLGPVVREALESYASGRLVSVAEVKRFFEAEPAFPMQQSGEITYQRVIDIIEHPIYTGHVHHPPHDAHWVKGRHEALISLITHEAIKERRADKPVAPIRKDTNADFPLRGFVLCGDCEKPLTAAWSKGQYKKYPYYLCDTKACVSGRKSIPRAKLEGAFADVLRALQPTRQLAEIATQMFRDAWTQRGARAKAARARLAGDIKRADKQMNDLLNRVVQATNPAVINAYEVKIAELDLEKTKLAEKLAKSEPTPGRMDEFIELSLQFLANPWKIWESGQLPLQRTVLRLAFAEPLAYHRNEGYRTPKTTLPFKVLGQIQQGNYDLVR